MTCAAERPVIRLTLNFRATSSMSTIQACSMSYRGSCAGVDTLTVISFDLRADVATANWAISVGIGMSSKYRKARLRSLPRTNVAFRYGGIEIEEDKVLVSDVSMEFNVLFVGRAGDLSHWGYFSSPEILGTIGLHCSQKSPCCVLQTVVLAHLYGQLIEAYLRRRAARCNARRLHRRIDAKKSAPQIIRRHHLTPMASGN
jgi:hypothetical protein